ncbi:MAG: peptidoglycan-binding protein, partial [Pseudomonadota bacterium]
AQLQRIYCYTNKQTSLSLIRELDRPGVLTLVDDNKRPVYAQLQGLGAQTATLSLGTQTFSLPLTLLADVWRGDFSTLRLAPEGYAEDTANGKNKPSADWVATQLAKLPG